MSLSTEQLALLARQHWVASAKQLGELGMAPRTLVRRRNSGLLATVLPGVVRLAAAEEDDEASKIAALLYVGGLSALTMQSGGGSYGLRRMYSGLVHVMVEEPRMPRAAPWIRIHRTSWLDPEDVIERPDGIRVLQPMRLLFEMAASFPKEKFRSAAEDMWHRRLIEPAEAAVFLGKVRRQGRTGVSRFEEWLQETEGRNTALMSGLETDLLAALEHIGLPTPERQYPLRLLSGTEIHIDLAFPEVKLGLEPGNTWWHGGNARMRQDYARDIDCAAVGWQIIRFEEEQLKDSRGCAEQARLAYRARQREVPSAPHSA